MRLCHCDSILEVISCQICSTIGSDGRCLDFETGVFAALTSFISHAMSRLRLRLPQLSDNFLGLFSGIFWKAKIEDQGLVLIH